MTPGRTHRGIIVGVDGSASSNTAVVGSHGRGGFTGMLLGSVSSAVMQSARTAVILARHS